MRILSVFLLCCLLSPLFNVFCCAVTGSCHVFRKLDDSFCNIQDNTKQYSATEKIVAFDVGQANCILVESNEQLAFIDCGFDSFDNTGMKLFEGKIAEYLNNKKLRYVFITHPHDDHYRLFLYLLENSLFSKCNCNISDLQVILGGSASLWSQKTSVFTQLHKNNLHVLYAYDQVNPLFNLGTANITILPMTNVYTHSIENDNQISSIINVSFNAFNALFTGDAQGDSIDRLFLKPQFGDPLHFKYGVANYDILYHFLPKTQLAASYFGTNLDDNVALDTLTKISKANHQDYLTYLKDVIDRRDYTFSCSCEEMYMAFDTIKSVCSEWNVTNTTLAKPILDPCLSIEGDIACWKSDKKLLCLSKGDVLTDTLINIFKKIQKVKIPNSLCKLYSGDTRSTAINFTTSVDSENKIWSDLSKADVNKDDFFSTINTYISKIQNTLNIPNDWVTFDQEIIKGIKKIKGIIDKSTVNSAFTDVIEYMPERILRFFHIPCGAIRDLFIRYNSQTISQVIGYDDLRKHVLEKDSMRKNAENMFMNSNLVFLPHHGTNTAGSQRLLGYLSNNNEYKNIIYVVSSDPFRRHKLPKHSTLEMIPTHPVTTIHPFYSSVDSYTSDFVNDDIKTLLYNNIGDGVICDMTSKPVFETFATHNGALTFYSDNGQWFIDDGYETYSFPSLTATS